MLIGLAYPMLAQVRVRCNVDDFESGALSNMVLPGLALLADGPHLGLEWCETGRLL